MFFKAPHLSITLGIAVIISFSACDSQRTANQNTTNSEQSQVLHIGDNSEVSVDWAGTYFGTLPCADCPGIRTSLTLKDDGTYILESRYEERGDSTYMDQGNFTWDATGGIITLNESEGVQYRVGEGRVFLLDQDGNRIEGALADHYTLTKASQQIQDIYWELIEINGQSITNIQNLNREPYMRLNSQELRAEANGGCNGMGGTYELDEENNRLRFSQFMSTKMACENMDIEQQLAHVIEQTDSYHVANDTLQLFKARIAPLAKFKAVYVK